MESPQLVLCNKTERVTIFKIPPLSTTKDYMLDDWKEMIWEGGVKVTQKNHVIKITFMDKHGKVFAQTKVPPNYKQAIIKTKDSSRGYAVRLDNPKGGYLWIGVAFRDRNDAFDFGVLFPDESSRNNIQANPKLLQEQFGKDVNFSLNKGEKIKINVGGSNSNKHKKSSNLSDNNAFGQIDFLQQSNPGLKKQEKQSVDWASFDFGPKKQTSKPSSKKESDNLIDFD